MLKFCIKDCFLRYGGGIKNQCFEYNDAELRTEIGNRKEIGKWELD
jgi:hypothetical protein